MEALEKSAQSSVDTGMTGSEVRSSSTSKHSSARPKKDEEKGMNVLTMKIKKHTLNLVTGKSQKRNPFYCKKFTKMEAEADTVIF